MNHPTNLDALEDMIRHMCREAGMNSDATIADFRRTFAGQFDHAQTAQVIALAEELKHESTDLTRKLERFSAKPQKNDADRT